MKNFNEVDIPQSLLHRLEELKFTTPTPIQSEAIPYALQGHDVLGSAQTGTGKTGAFGIPLITHMINDEDAKALILVPTRELALQVMQALKDFIGRDNIKTALLIGGEPIGKQFKQLRNRPRLIIGTPGRVNDHLKRRTVEFDETNFLVLDEVDRMLDMGFSVQLDEIAKYLPRKRQTLMFSATMPKNMDSIAAKYLTDPVRVSVGSTTAAAPKVKQEFIKVRDEEKYTQLITELEARTGSIIIFIKTKYNAENMAKKLRGKGYEAEAIHGDLKQSRRARVIKSFRQKEYRILVATDVASRGLDIPHIEHVINYDAPHNPEDYIHRIGRTARAGADGEAVNFMGNRDAKQWLAVQRLLNPDDHQSYAPRGGRKKESFYERKRQNGRKSAFGDKKSYSNKPWKNDKKPEEKYKNTRHKDDGYKNDNRDDRPARNSAKNDDSRRHSRSDTRSDERGGFKKDFKKKDFKRNSNGNKGGFGKDFRKDSDRDGRRDSRPDTRSDTRSDSRIGSNDDSRRDYPKKDYSNRGPRRDASNDSRRDSSRDSGRSEGKWERKSSGGSSEGGKKPYRPSNGGGKSFSSSKDGGRSYAGKNKASRRRFNSSNG